MDLQGGLAELNRLSLAEYGPSLAELTSDPDREMALQRLARLIGVAIKEPFAEARPAPPGASATGANHQWWLTQARFDEAVSAGAWQVLAVDALREDLGRTDPYVASLTTFAFVDYTQSERGLFSWLAVRVGEYICNDPEVRAAVEAAFRKVVGTDAVKPPTPESVVMTAGLTVGTYLTQHIPALAVAGPVVLAGLVLILYARGVGAFCQRTQHPVWTDDATSEMH